MHKAIEGVFNPQRLFLLLRRDLAHGYRAVLTAMAAVGGILIVLSFLSMLGRAGQDFYTPFYVGLLFLGGFLFSSGAFKEMHQQGSGPFYLTLPGTTLEKLLSKLLVTSLGYAAAVLLFMTGASAVSELLNRAVFGAGHTWFNPLSQVNLKSAAVYLVLQSLFLLGSVWFRKVVFLKIVLAENIVVIGLAILAAIIFRVTFAGFFSGSHLKPEVIQMFSQGFGNVVVNGHAAEAFNRGSQVFLTILRVLFWAAFAPVCWVAAYFRLRETEV
ncbi:MAG: hypothetical protein ACHQ1F_02770 [Spirochaetia bacterium]